MIFFFILSKKKCILQQTQVLLLYQVQPMIRGYKKEAVIDKLNQHCSIYKVEKGGFNFLIHQFSSINESDEYTFKVRKKLSKCSHVVTLVEQFEQDDKKYYISEYIQADLLKLAQGRPGHVLQLHQALSYFAKLVEVLDQLHDSKLIYRNVRPQKIRIKGNELCLYDFSMSQFVKRRERMFQIVGCGTFLAPEFFSEDGYGYEVDIWAAGVLLFYLLVHQYPFKFKSNEEAAFRQEFNLKCGQGFKFSHQIAHTNFYGPPLKGNKNLQDFFKKIFQKNPKKRLTISDIKQHPLMENFFQGQVDKEMLAIIQQQGKEQSLFLSYMQKFPCSKILHKQEVILDFIEQTSQLFFLECTEIYSEELRYRVQFSVLKVGLVKCRDLIDIIYGKKDPFFKINPKDWQEVRASSALNLVKEKLQRKNKILKMIYKNAFLNVKNLIAKDPFFNQELPQCFDDVKVPYRGNLNQMFQIGRKTLAKTKQRKLCRKLTESLVRVIILYLINRVFESEENINQDFSQYLAWSKTKDFGDLQDWIETQELANLKIFMKEVTSKYL